MAPYRIIVTITRSAQVVQGVAYDYTLEDTVRRDLLNETIVATMSGQTFGGDDYLLTQAVRDKAEFLIYARAKNGCFTYFGSTTKVSITRPREVAVGVTANPSELLRLEFVIPKQRTKEERVPAVCLTKPYHYKKDVFGHAKAVPPHNNLTLGFFKVA